MISDAEIAKPKLPPEDARELLAHAARLFANRPFKRHSIFASGHAQTLASFAWPRRRRLRSRTDEERLFTVAPNTIVLAHCRWHAKPIERPTIVIWHGIEGSSSAVYMLATAQKAFRAGFNVLRMNLRNCGGTEHLTPTLYHGGLSEDLRAVVKELIAHDGLSKIFLIGFSLGGNMVLKLAGEYGEQPPKEVLAICAISPSVDLSASADSISHRSNWLYHRDFLRRLIKRIRIKQKLYPELYDISDIHLIRTLREFDDRFTSVAHGFANANDYYQKASSIRVISRIRIPTLIIHGQDDPFIPFAPLRSAAVAENPYILLVAPERGGHVAFVAAKPSRSQCRADERSLPDGDRLGVRDSAKPVTGVAAEDSRFMIDDSPTEDRFWAENRVVEFCQLANNTR